jgi:glycosyltransferase involved in cell wall biosynthesis
MGKTVSVIVPVYNAARYLERCLNSILKQDYKDLDIILVNDGSTDESFYILEEYRKRDPRIRLISQQNAGPSEARNRGIEVATGDYLCFVDADDWLDDHFLERMVSVHEETGSDVTICNYKQFEEEKSVIYYYADFKEKYVKEYLTTDWFRFVCGNANLCICHVVVWGKIYNRELFQNIRYPVGKIAEDDFTTHYAYLLSDKITYIHEPLYIYRKNPEGITSTRSFMERFPLQSLEEAFTMAILAGIDASVIRMLYLERLLGLREWFRRAGKAEEYRHVCLKIEALKKHGVKIE